MKNLFTLLLIAFAFLSCDSDSNERENIVETYTFKKIEYYATKNSVEFSSVDLPAITYNNNSSLEQKWSYNPLGGQSDKSQFVSNDAEAFKVGNIDVFTPLYIDEDYVISLDSRKWKYSNNIEKQDPNLNLLEDIAVPANKKLTLNCKLFLRKYTVNYKLYLKGYKTEQEKIIEGKWIGTYYDSSEITTSYSNL